MKKPTTTVVFLALFFIFAALLTPRVLKVQNLKARSRDLEVELKKLQLQNATLENELRLLRDDPVYLEKVAREKFNKAKQGEIVYKVVRE